MTAHASAAASRVRFAAAFASPSTAPDLRHRRRRLRRRDSDLSLSGVDAAGVPFFASRSRSNTRTGWTVGGGIAYAVTNDRVDQGQYRYTDFGTIRRGAVFPGRFFQRAPSVRGESVQVGFSYKFDTYVPPPVVAEILSRVLPPRLPQKQNPASRPGFSRRVKNCYLHGLEHDIDLHIDILLAGWEKNSQQAISSASHLLNSSS